MVSPQQSSFDKRVFVVKIIAKNQTFEFRRQIWRRCTEDTSTDFKLTPGAHRFPHSRMDAVCVYVVTMYKAY